MSFVKTRQRKREREKERKREREKERKRERDLFADELKVFIANVLIL